MRGGQTGATERALEPVQSSLQALGNIIVGVSLNTSAGPGDPTRSVPSKRTRLAALQRDHKHTTPAAVTPPSRRTLKRVRAYVTHIATKCLSTKRRYTGTILQFLKDNNLWVGQGGCLRENGKPYRKNHPSDRDSNLDLPVIGSLVYCKSSALDHGVTEAGIKLALAELTGYSSTRDFLRSRAKGLDNFYGCYNQHGTDGAGFEPTNIGSTNSSVRRTRRDIQVKSKRHVPIRRVGGHTAYGICLGLLGFTVMRSRNGKAERWMKEKQREIKINIKKENGREEYRERKRDGIENGRARKEDGLE
uniref:Uncharacterized protein n=1 Tax=Timema monikensis TaxID=170555 RepID=A0A7R9ECI5_9NEOP|nr:unnamed protein product [Timema monikensis]